MNKLIATLSYFLSLTTLGYGMEFATTNTEPFEDIIIVCPGTYTITSAPKNTYYVKHAPAEQFHSVSQDTLVIRKHTQKTPIEIGVPKIQTIKILDQATITCVNVNFGAKPQIIAQKNTRLWIKKANSGSLTIAMIGNCTVRLEDIKIKTLSVFLDKQSTLIIDKATIDTLLLSLKNQSKASHTQHSFIMKQLLVLSKDSGYEAEKVESKEVEISIEDESFAHLGMIAEKLTYEGNLKNVKWSGAPRIIKLQ